MMTEEELQTTLKDAQWTLVHRTRRKTKLRYASAQKRIKGTLLEVYIAPVASLGKWSKEQVLEKLRLKLEKLPEDKK